MTEKELSRYYKLKREIEDLEIRIKEFGDGVKGLQTKDVVISGGGGNISIQEKLMLLQSEYIEKRVSALEQYKEIDRYFKRSSMGLFLNIYEDFVLVNGFDFSQKKWIPRCSFAFSNSIWKQKPRLSK